MTVTADELLKFAAGLESERWKTLDRKKPFRYEIDADGITFIPASSGTARPVSRRKVADFCARFERQGSYAPGDYPESFQKSYLLALIKRFSQERE